jgi:hypothetical protein
MNKCDFCNQPAKYDGKTLLGPWGYMCQKHFDMVGTKVRGLYTVLPEAKLPEKRCTKCGTLKPISAFLFYMDQSGKKIYHNECYSCNPTNRLIASIKRRRGPTNGRG